MIKTFTLALTCCLASLLVSGCGGSVERVDPDETIDLSGEWNDTDSRMVAEEMIADSLSRPWATDFIAGNQGKKPVVRVAPQDVRIRTNGDTISKEVFLNDLRRSFINSGRVRVVSTAGEASATRAELADQQEHASEASRKEQKQELGADFILHGEINVQDDVKGRKRLRFYSVDLMLTNVQTREQVWIGNKKLKKLVTGASTR